ncbi:hypothetical protein ACYATP_03180 [Lactobacillaceae bacterium Melli_B4]
MKTYQKLIPVALLGLLLAGCGSKDSDNQNASMKNSQTSSSVVKKDSSSSSSSQASSSSSASSNQSSSAAKTNAATTSTNNGVTTKTYASEAMAKDQIDYQSKSANDGLPMVNLGDGIKGVKDGGAGQVFVTFYMGRWSISVRGTDVNVSDTATPAAKKIVAYLQNHTLPVPQNQGSVMADVDANTTTVKWQNGNKVMTVNGTTPESALQTAVSAQ